MMNKDNMQNKLMKLKLNKDIFFVIGLLIICMFYDMNTMLDYIFIMAFFVLLLIGFDSKIFPMLYFVLMPFINVLAIPNISFSLYLIYEVLIVLRFYFVCLKYPKSKLNVYIFAFMILNILLGLINFNGVSGLISVGLNSVVMYMTTYEIIANADEDKGYFNKFLIIISIFAISAGIYGVFRMVALDYGSFDRLIGPTGDPNYTAFYFCIGIVASYCINKEYKKTRIGLSLLNIVFLAMTVSMGGIAIMLVVFIVMLFVDSPKKGIFAFMALAIAGIIFLLIDWGEGSALHGIRTRILRILEQIFIHNNFSAATSGRTRIWGEYMAYFAMIPLFNYLLGGINITSGVYREFFVADIGFISHNSFIDLLFYAGVFGFSAYMLFILYGGIKNVRMLKKTKDYRYLAFFAFKLIVIGFGFDISFAFNRQFLGFLLWI